MRCLALVYWVIMRSGISPIMKDFVFSIFQKWGRGGSGKLPSNVGKLFIEWGELSKWYMNGGIIREKFIVGEKKYDVVTIRSTIGVVQSQEGRR